MSPTLGGCTLRALGLTTASSPPEYTTNAASALREGSLAGHGTVVVEKGVTLNRRRVAIADTLTVRAIGGGLVIIFR